MPHDNLFDTLGFACPKVLGNIRRNCITDGHEDQGENILHPHRRRISCKSLCAERIYHCLYDHHTDRHGRLLQNRGYSDPKHRAQLAPIKPLKRALYRRIRYKKIKSEKQRKYPGQSELQAPHRIHQAPDRLPSKDPSQYSGWMKRSAAPAEFLIHRWK